MEPPTPLWDAHNRAHVLRHKVTPDEVQEVVFSAAPILLFRNDSQRKGRIHAWGVTDSGRHLVIVFDTPTPAFEAYVVTARPMTNREKAAYRKGTE
jgi:uncharacterized DUF497 family protein